MWVVPTTQDLRELILATTSLINCKQAKELSVNVEGSLIDFYHHFLKCVKRKSQLREFMEFSKKKVRKILKHVANR